MALDPVYQTLFLGQINLILLALILTDVWRVSRGRDAGIGVGIAAAIKLTPAIFIVFFLLARRTKAAVIAAATFIVCGLIGFRVAPRASTLYWEHLSHDTRRVGAPYISNQSPYGTAIRIAEGQGHIGAWWTEGTHGFYRAFGGANEYPFEKFSELGRTWEIPKLTFKSYPCGSISHPYMDCAQTLRQKYAIAPERVTEIVCRTAEGPVHRLWEPLELKRTPPTSYAAKFSLPFSIAVMLIRGRAGLEEFSDEAILDPEILSLAKKVRYELDPTIDYPRHFSGHVKIRLADGTILEENQPHPRGGLETPLPPEEIEAKFRANARLALPEGQLDLIVKSVKTLEQLPSITTLTDQLIGHDPEQKKA